MKTNTRFLIAFFVLLLAGAELQAQYGYGRRNGYGYGYGRGRSAIPQADITPKEPEPKTAEEIVDGEMPKIATTLELNDFETAVLSSVLKKYLQKRMELRILELPPDKMREGMAKITEQQDEELKAGLPLEKYEAFVQLQKDGLQKAQKKQKKKKRKKKKSKEKEE